MEFGIYHYILHRGGSWGWLIFGGKRLLKFENGLILMTNFWIWSISIIGFRIGFSILFRFGVRDFWIWILGGDFRFGFRKPKVSFFGLKSNQSLSHFWQKLITIISTLQNLYALFFVAPELQKEAINYTGNESIPQKKKQEATRKRELLRKLKASWVFQLFFSLPWKTEEFVFPLLIDSILSNLQNLQKS